MSCFLSLIAMHSKCSVIDVANKIVYLQVAFLCLTATKVISQNFVNR